MSNTLYACNLPFKISDEELKSHFATAGKVIALEHVHARDSGRSNGCGFIEMKDSSAARNAVARLHGSELDGRKINVTIARPI
tara:strand:+ start:793 stop:1041 length:249 start_codon:yes stop_codon:yes gene_type:complete